MEPTITPRLTTETVIVILNQGKTLADVLEYGGLIAVESGRYGGRYINGDGAPIDFVMTVHHVDGRVITCTCTYMTHLYDSPTEWMVEGPISEVVRSVIGFGR